MTSKIAATSTRTRLLGLLVAGAACVTSFAASAQDHRPPPHHPVHHRHQVCHSVRVRDHHGHFHTERQCHWVNR